MGGARVYVGNIPSRATERDLESFFRGFGRIRDVMLKNGFGFVEFDDLRDAEDAVYEQNGRDFLGELVVVEISRRERPSGDGYNFRGDFRGRGRGGFGRGGFGGPNFRGGFRGGGGGMNPRFNNRYGPPVQTRYRLIVYNLSTRCSWQDLKDLMRNAGEVTYADAHKKVRNEALVCFASHHDLKRALERYQGKDINGRRIKLVDDSESYGNAAGRRSSRSPRSRSRSRSAHRSRSRSPSQSRTPSPAANGRSRTPSRSRSRSPSTPASKKSGSSPPRD